MSFIGLLGLEGAEIFVNETGFLLTKEVWSTTTPLTVAKLVPENGGIRNGYYY